MKTKLYLSFLTLTTLLLSISSVQAQTYQPSNRTPASDSTLGTQVSGSGGNFNITGGVSKGQTLFHSFTDFSVPTNGQANFLNPVGNRDIITRVTGNLFSDLNGAVNTNGANFFLINPSGIVFGPNAQLNVGKAFVGSTANSLDLVDGSGRTITFGTNTNGDAPLLAVNPNVMFNVSRLNLGGGSGAISNFGTLQTNNDSQYIGLIGGNVTLDGGKIIAPGGRIDVGGLKSAGTVTVDNSGLVFGGNGLQRGDVVLTNGAGITARVTGTLSPVNTFFNNATSNGSSINISANNIDVLNSGTKLNTQPAAIDAGLDLNLKVPTKVAGDININATGKVNLDNSGIKNSLRTGSEGGIGDIKIQADTLDIINNSVISSATSGKGNAGNIDLNVNGDIYISGNTSSSTKQTLTNFSFIGSNTYGQGNTGKITINTQGKLSLVNLGSISSDVGDTGVGNGKGISINARELVLSNGSSISSSTVESAQGISKGNGGDINIKTTGDIQISGYNILATNPATAISSIGTDTQGYGDAGKITIDTPGKLSLINQGRISSIVQDTAVGNGRGIVLNVRELNLANNSSITTTTYQATQANGKGNAGDINITTSGDINVAGSNLPSFLIPSPKQRSHINSDNNGYGNAGKITINAQGKLSVINESDISSEINGVGNSKGITINAREVAVTNGSLISTSVLTDSKGDGGDIEIKTNGDIKIAGSNSSIQSVIAGRGDTGKITIDTQGKLSIDRGAITNFTSNNSIGNSKGISIVAKDVEIINSSFISSSTGQSAVVNGTGKGGNVNLNIRDSLLVANKSNISTVSLGTGLAGDINLNAKGSVSLNNSDISTGSGATGQTGNISVTSDKLLLDKSYFFGIGSLVTGGNIKISISDKLLMRNNSFIDSQSFSTTKNGNGGNITISSPLIIALPGNNDIVANAEGGAGGNVKITSQGLFGIKYRSKGQESNFTNDITASSTFGQSGNVSISTPGTDPGKDSTELPKTTTDASKQISQVCSATNRQNKLTVTGRGGLPPTANDPLTSDVIWQDARAASSQPVASSATTNPVKLAPPAVGWIFDSKGKVTLVAAKTAEQPTGTSVVCPNIK
jgi:filamentous hemagglutinin family protein